MTIISKLVLLAMTVCLFNSQAYADNRPSFSEQEEALRALGLEDPSAKKITPFKTFNTDSLRSLKNKPITMDLAQVYDLSKKKAFDKQRTLGGADGGSGKFLLFKKSGKMTAQLLDIYEAEQRGLVIDLGPGSTLEQKLDYVLNRLAKVAPFRANAYRIWLNDLLSSEAEFVENVILPNLDDLGATVLPIESEIVQVAIQRNQQEVDLGLKRYVIDRNIFAQLDPSSQVALLFHEVVYREARSRGDTTSVRSRFLTGAILSKAVGMISREKFNELTEKSGSACSEKNGSRGMITTCAELPAFYVNEEIPWGWPEGKVQHATFDLGEKVDFKTWNAVAETLNISKDIQREIFRKKVPLAFTLAPMSPDRPFKIEQAFELVGDGRGTLEGDFVISDANLAYTDAGGFNSLTGNCSLRSQRAKKRILVSCSKWKARQDSIGSSRGITNFIITEDGLEILKKD